MRWRRTLGLAWHGRTPLFQGKCWLIRGGGYGLPLTCETVTPYQQAHTKRENENSPSIADLQVCQGPLLQSAWSRERESAWAGASMLLFNASPSPTSCWSCGALASPGRRVPGPVPEHQVAASWLLPPPLPEKYCKPPQTTRL